MDGDIRLGPNIDLANSVGPMGYGFGGAASDIATF